MTAREQRHTFAALMGTAGAGLFVHGLRLRLSRELSGGFMVFSHEARGQLLLLSSVNVQP